MATVIRTSLQRWHLSKASPYGSTEVSDFNRKGKMKLASKWAVHLEANKGIKVKYNIYWAARVDWVLGADRAVHLPVSLVRRRRSQVRGGLGLELGRLHNGMLYVMSRVIEATLSPLLTWERSWRKFFFSESLFLRMMMVMMMMSRRRMKTTRRSYCIGSPANSWCYRFEISIS